MSGYDQDRLADYVDVPARIAEFRTKHPEGSLQPADPTQPYRVEQIGDRFYIVVVAAAYRSPDDPRPGIGMAYEQWPGKTPYTRDSELQNAETSAWGRAIVAVLAADTKRGIATREDVRNRRAEDEESAATREQDVVADDFADEIQAAGLQATIDDIGSRVRISLAGGRITTEQYQRLGRMAMARVQAIGGSRDSTSDSDRSGSSAQQTGAGAGLDGEGAGERGPESNDEAGPLRPGVQPAVHQRDGVSGSAQASRDDRGARAEVGGRRE